MMIINQIISKIYDTSTNERYRNEWIEKKLSQIPKGLSILDAGAGEQKWKSTCEHLKYVSQDFCQYEGSGNGKGLQTSEWNTDMIDIVSDITDIPVEDDSFDVILCSEVLEHIPHPEMAIREFSRILKKGGQLILTAPFASLTHFAPFYFCSGFSEYWYNTNLPEYGFEVDEIVSNGNYFSWIAQELFRTPILLQQYGLKCPLLVRIGGIIMTFGMRKYFHNEVSSDILCFGYMVCAHKL